MGGGVHGCQLLKVEWVSTQSKYVYGEGCDSIVLIYKRLQNLGLTFDGIVLVLACWALFRFPGRSTGLWKVLFMDGLAYFVSEYSRFVRPHYELTYLFQSLSPFT